MSAHHATDSYLGMTIDGAILEKKLGQGGMGAVYLARHINLQKYVAIKILPPVFTQDPQYVARFLREARSSAKLEHPNIIQIHNVGEQDGTYFISMQLIRGQSLQQLIETQPISLSQALWVMKSAMQGLFFAHQNGIIHRDIKPDNIMLTTTGELKIVDFGLARTSQSGNTLSSPGQIMGTPYFMSPEQCNGDPVDARSDIYSLGITFYALLAGKPPYEGKTPISVLMQHTNSDPPKTLEAVPHLQIPAEISSLILRMMSKSLKDRYSNLQEPLQELESLSARFQFAPLCAKSPAWAEDPNFLPTGLDLPTQKVQIASKLLLSKPSDTLQSKTSSPATQKMMPSASQNVQPTVRLNPAPATKVNSLPPLNLWPKRIGVLFLILLLPMISIGIYKTISERNQNTTPSNTSPQTSPNPLQRGTKGDEEEKDEDLDTNDLTQANLKTLKTLHQKLKKQRILIEIARDHSLLEKIRTLYAIYQKIEAGEIVAKNEEKQTLINEFQEEFDVIKKTTKKSNPTAHNFIFGAD